MSYGYHITGDALADLREFDGWLQEEVLDELERLAQDPKRLRAGKDGEAIHDFDRRLQDVRHVIFVSVRLNDAAQVLTVIGIASCSTEWREP